LQLDWSFVLVCLGAILIVVAVVLTLLN